MEDCQYAIGFNCFRSRANGKLKFNGQTFFVSFGSNGNYFELFSIEDTVGVIKHFPPLDGCLCWSDKEEYLFELQDKICRDSDVVLVVQIDSLLPVYDFGYMDYTFFLSTKYGFMGNYLTLPNDTNIILQEYGDIARDAIDYSKFRFARIK